MADDKESSSALRRHSRIPLDARIRVVWEQDGHYLATVGRTVDVTETGLGILLKDPIPMRTRVSFEVNSVNLRGTATVRFLHRKGLNHIVGLEFVGSLRWKSPAPAPA